MSLRNINRDQAAQSLCDFVLGMDIKLAELKEWRPEDEDDQVNISEEFSFIHVLGVPSFDFARWAVVRAGWVSPLKESDLQKRINEKAKKISSYQAAVQKMWLLVIADATKPSSQIKAKPDFTVDSIASPFQRTFFYRYPDSYMELCVGN